MMAKWFIHCVLTVVCLSATPALSDKFTAVKDMKYHIISRAQSIFTASSLSHIRKFNDSRTPRDFVYENQFNFDPVRPTRIFVHGFYSDMTLMDSYAKSYLDIGDFNFIAVDWLAGARTLNYPVARHRVREVGEALAVFIDHLVEVMGMNLEDLILVGHSLGAHICGWAGKSVTSGKLPVIIGLDPALPLFSLKHSKHRLAYTDARYVQIIHTCGGRLGIKHSIGHADFYPNFGRHQPGCTGLTSDVCSHTRVHDLFQESLRRPFWAQKCSSYTEILNGNCTKIGTAIMGGDIGNMEQAFGLFYLQTLDKTPFVVSNGKRS